MHTITIEDFENTLAGEDWTHEQDYRIEERVDRRVYAYGDDAGVLVEKKIPHAMGYASIVSTLGDIEITYIETFRYDVGNADSLYVVGGYIVTDLFDSTVDANSLPEAFRKIDYSKIELN